MNQLDKFSSETLMIFSLIVSDEVDNTALAYSMTTKGFLNMKQ